MVFSEGVEVLNRAMKARDTDVVKAGGPMS
jgi:hypothetical protein